MARADFANLGRVGDLAPSQSPLALGLRGRVGQDEFVLVGRAQRRNATGGQWDEWYAHFPHDDHWGWLTEAQGQFHLLFERTLVDPTPAESMALGAQMPLEGVAFTVHEVGEAQTTAAAGELPFAWHPGEAPEPYADATGPRQTFMTLCPHTPETVYLGRTLSLRDLGLAAAAPAERAAAGVPARQLACPQCGGSLELFTPDRSERMGCPYCGALLDVRQEAAQILVAAATEARRYDLTLGSYGTFAGVRYRLLGALRRGTESDGVAYTWDEYLLYEPQVGYRWLVCAQGHWSFVEPVRGVTASGRSALYNFETYKIFGSCTATVVHVLGEFYWQVQAGQQSRMDDFVCPPRMLSREDDDHEVVWSLGMYLPRRAVEKAFGQKLPDLARGVAPHEPWPHRGIFTAALVLTVMGYVLKWILAAALQQPTALETQIDVGPQTQTSFSESFQLTAGRNVAVSAAALGTAGWVHVDGDLVGEASGTVQPWSLDLGSNNGDGDGDGDANASSNLGEETVWLPGPSDGGYTLRTEAAGGSVVRLRITVRQGVPNADSMLRFALFNGVIALIFFIKKHTFEGRRWQDSDTGGQL